MHEANGNRDKRCITIMDKISFVQKIMNQTKYKGQTKNSVPSKMLPTLWSCNFHLEFDFLYKKEQEKKI